MIASASSRWPLPSTPAMPTISPARTSRSTPFELAAARSPSTCRTGSPISTLGFSSRNRTGRPTIISASLALVVPAGSASPDHAAPPQHRDAVGDVEDLVELVADEHDRLAGLAQASEVLEQLLGLLRREHRGGLVEDQHVDAPVERLQDLDTLLLADRQVLDRRRSGRTWKPYVAASSATRSCAASMSRTAASLVAQDDVLGRR